ncbi:TonB-dependent receptor [Winogradskyella echinorum]|uniref:TonB-dependent receptor n=1 Tax=Winogradskyella echinorum TaxID=538189 RepID=A0ABR6XWD1_9FLAO|nr:TonB-dependent receptor [Winogradskyella echinorum]MBC3844791.1 TonB-dependent receptor [Winogradskyella echinorum]MBC5749139.1 TonB-dependent receptor [Winogradskyella echinorum]
MNLKVKLTTIVALLFSVMIFAQESYTINGTVKSADTMPIPGANILVVGTTNGTSTDFDGKFQIEVKKGDVLQVSYVGYVTKTIVIDSQQNLDVVLAEDNALEEVVIVGYGTRKKSHSTGAIAQLKGKDVAAVQATRVDEALAGKLSGVLVQNQSGEPGADLKIQVRAASSISGDSGPLIVVDGYPISGNLATVNPNDIESLEVLKDAASAAIYGTLGANGVILVTTKKGKSGKAKFSYNTYISSSKKYRDNILKSGPEWAAFSRQEIAAGNWDLSQIDPAFVEYRLRAYENSPGAISPEDWLFRTGTTSNHDFSVSGGSENVNYFGSVGYQNAEGVAITQGFERVNARLNVDANLGERLTAGISFNGFTSKRDILAHDMRDLLRSYGVHPVYHTAASIAFVQSLDVEAQNLGLAAFDNGYRGGVGPSSIYDLVPGNRVDDWHYGRANNGIGGSGDAGPAQKLDNADQWERTYFANVSTYLQYEILDGLNAKTILGADMNDTQNYYYQGLAADSRARTDQTDLDQTDLKRSSMLSITTLDYSKVIGKHDISAVIGYEFQNTYLQGTALRGTNVPFSDIINYNLLEAADITVTERDETRTRNSVFGRVQYAYDDRYLASFSVRRDGDSRFGANNKFATFPAFSLGWNAHNEEFWNSELVSLLKLRVSSGSLGTASFLGSYDSLSLLNPGATIFGTGFLSSANIDNPDLTWQTNTETNFGLDLGFKNNRFRFSVDYYTSDIEDMLFGISQSYTSTGQNSRIINGGDMTSSGLELELSAGLIQTEDFSWSVNANLSTVETEITSLNGLAELPQVQYGQSGRGPVFRNYVGGELGEMWGLETIGEVEMLYLEDPTRHPNNTSGESYVVDQNNDGVINSDDYVKIGQATPDFYWGFSSSMNYKDFDLSFQFQGSHGAEVYNIDPLYYESQWSGRLVDSFDANDDGIADHNGEHYIGNRRQTDSGIQDASYIALRNLTLGYTLRPEWISKVGISSARIYAAATNLLYIMGDDYTSYNPEGVETTNTGYAGPTTYGVQVGASPIVRSFTLGLNVNF